MVNKKSPRKIFDQRGAVRMIYVTGDCHADFTRSILKFSQNNMK